MHGKHAFLYFHNSVLLQDKHTQIRINQKHLSNPKNMYFIFNVNNSSNQRKGPSFNY